MLDPALATLAFLVVSVLSPSVLAGKRFSLIHSLTVPTLFMALVYGIKSLGRYAPSNMQRIEDAVRSDLVWLNLEIVFEAWIVLVLVFLFVSAVLVRDRQEPKS